MVRISTGLLPAAVLLTLACSAPAQQHASPGGFSFQCPQGWLIAPEDPNDPNLAGLADEFPFLARLDANRTAALLFLPRDEGFPPRLGIDVIQGTVRANAENAKAALKQNAAAIKRYGGAESNAAYEMRHFADRSTIFIRHDVRYPEQEEWLRQWQVLVPGKGRTLVVTCTAAAADFASAEPAFTQVLNSLQVPDRPGSLLSDMPTLTKGIILGAILMGAIIFLRVARAMKRKFPKATDH